MSALKRFCLSIAAVFVFFGCTQNLTTNGNKVVYQNSRPDSGGLFSSGKYRSIAIADLNDDGNLDVVGGSSTPGTVTIWYGDGRGGLSEPEFMPFRGDVRSIAIADVNSDGLKDVICSVQRESVGILVWLNRAGQRWERGISPVETGKYEGVVAVDFDGDGNHDIAAANAASDDQGGIQVWFGDGRGNWRAESGPTVKGVYMDVAVADFDRDGFLDLAGSGWGTYGGLRIWFGDGTGGWSSALHLSRGSYYGLSLTDLNGDKNPDILAATYREGVQIFLGHGNGSFYKDTDPEKTGSFWKVLPLELSGEGDKELLASSLDAKGLVAWQRRDAETWVPISGMFSATGSYYEIATGDLNQDGHDDLCAASYGQGVKVWLGKGGFSVTSQRLTGAKGKSPETLLGAIDIQENAVFSTASGIPEYKIGPGDVIEIILWKGIEKTSEEIQVRPNGSISFGFVEDLDVTGLTPSQLDEVLTRRLSEFVRRPRIDITVKKFNSKFITLVGAIKESLYRRSGPGQYELTGKTTLLEMVTKAGGPTTDANLNKVTVRRKNGRSFNIDLYKTLTQRDFSQNIVLDDGDLILIPTLSTEANRVYVFGEVKKPGVYTFSGSQMSLFDAISEAGGITVFAKESSTKIVRGEIARPEVISADLKMLIENGDITQNIALANRDLVYVPRSTVGDINRFVKQITPLMRLIIYPAQVINEFGTAGEWLDITEP